MSYLGYEAVCYLKHGRIFGMDSECKRREDIEFQSIRAISSEHRDLSLNFHPWDQTNVVIAEELFAV